MADHIPVRIDNLEKDYNTIRDRLMDELCKRQKYVDRNGGPDNWAITEVWQDSCPAFTSREYIDNFIHRYRKYSQYFENLPNDRIRLTEHGKRCKDREK